MLLKIKFSLFIIYKLIKTPSFKLFQNFKHIYTTLNKKDSLIIFVDFLKFSESLSWSNDFIPIHYATIDIFGAKTRISRPLYKIFSTAIKKILFSMSRFSRPSL